MSRDALIVGINSYLWEGLANLTSPAHDAEAIAQRLSQHGDFYVKRMPEFLDPFEENVRRVAHNQDLTVAQLEAALEQLFYPEGNSIPDTALFYFSGHGRQDAVWRHVFLWSYFHHGCMLLDCQLLSPRRQEVSSVYTRCSCMYWNNLHGHQPFSLHYRRIICLLFIRVCLLVSFFLLFYQ